MKIDKMIGKVMLSLSLLMGGAGLSAQAQVALEDIQFVALPGEAFEISMTFDSRPPQPEVFEVDNPPRLSMDFPGVVSALEDRRFPLQYDLAESVMVLESQGRTRMVVNLYESTSYTTRLQGNTLHVVVGETRGSGATSAASAPSSRRTTAATSAADIRTVDFRRGAEGGGQVVIELADNSISGNVKQAGSRLSLTFSGADLAAGQQARLDVIDYATPVRYIDVYEENGDVQVVAEVSGDYEYIAYQSANQYIISVLSKQEAEDMGLDEEFEYVGEPIDLDFQDVDIRSVLYILAEFNDFSLVVSDSVTGNITISLDDVPWDQALEMVLRSRGLDSRQEGTVLYVAPAAELADSELQALENNQQAEQLAPLQTEYLNINYAVASEILGIITGANNGGQLGGGVAAAGGQGQMGISTMLSPRGSASVDERTNTLIVRDVRSVIEDVREMLAVLDVPVRQVLIEARIVNAEAQFSEALGVRWGGWQTASGAGDGFYLSNSVGSVTPDPGGDFTIDGLMVDLGVPSASSSIALGYAGNNGLLQLELSALEDSGNGEVVAQPKVTTQDQQTARIESGLQIPYQAQAGGTAGGSTTEFVTAALSLEVTPQITPDGRIIMLLDIHQDSVAPTGTGGVPAISTNSVITRVLVDDGDTIVLGGVFREEEVSSVSKTMFMGDLPYVGRLFRRNQTSTTKTELLIFITPSIINEI